MKSLFALLALATAFAQSPAFELASIKPSDPTSAMALRRSGDRIVTVNTSLQFLISWAYDIHPERIYAKPNWLDTVHYDIVATGSEDDRPAPPRVPGQPSAYQQRMQALLAERFKLAVHRENRELPLYALIVGKGGHKLHLAKAPDSMGQTPFSMPGRGRLIGTQVSAAMLAKVLSDQLGRSVQDETGLDGVFDFKLEWDPDPASARPDALPATGAASSLFSAIQEQLGLKLEGRKGQVEVLVIDRIERAPTAN